MNQRLNERSGDEEAFQLLKSLGTGGFAHTYLAKVVDEDLVEEFGTNEVALKIPLSKKKEKALRVELGLFIALNLRLKNVHSINIVPYLGFTVFGGQIVMAMRYMSNGNLRNLIGPFGRGRCLPMEQVVRLSTDVLKGLQVIHEEHILHRDIKPENVLMDGETAKIADFGISRMLESNEMASTTTGTIFYMAPEILGSDGASFPADIWSMGVMIYEMATGRLPFGDKNTQIGTMADLIRRADHQPACEVCPDVPVPFSKIIDRALSKEPGARPTSRELHDGLLDLLKKQDALESEIAPIREQMAGGNASADIESRLRQIVRRHARNPKAYQYLGEFFNQCQMHLDALNAFQKGLELDQKNAPLMWDCALACQRLGRKQDAVKHLKGALAQGLDPSLKRFAQSLLRALEGGAG
jgi:serine/threonine protein kinase